MKLALSRASSPTASVEFTGGIIKVVDSSTSNDAYVQKAGIAIQPNEEAVFQVEVRMLSHFRTSADWGNEIRMAGLSPGNFNGSVLVATTKVGFPGSSANSFTQSHSIDTTGDFHLIRVTKASGTIQLYVDDMSSPVLTGAATPAGATVNFYPISTSQGGVAEFDVRSFAFNIGSTVIPEPSSAALMLAACAVGLRRNRNRLG